MGARTEVTNEKELTHIDLFSGIGGFTLAAEWAGFETIVFCEKEKFCQKVLKKHWPEIPIIEEIRDFDGTKYQGATLLTGGFPCQPFSQAGQRRGKEDDRYLWPEMLRVIDEARPHWILAENVPGIFRMALDTVLSDLESKGYSTGTFIIPACGLNAPHRRNRVWIVAHSESERNRGRTSDKCSISEWPLVSGKQKGSKVGSKNQGRIGFTTGSHAPDSKAGRSGRHESESIKERSTSRSIWQENWHEVATRFCGMDDGISDRIHRLKALGNAIVPQIAYEILKNIAWIENNRVA